MPKLEIGLKQTEHFSDLQRVNTVHYIGTPISDSETSPIIKLNNFSVLRKLQKRLEINAVQARVKPAIVNSVST